MELYIHIPFCRKKCIYCDFLSFCKTGSVHEDYVFALLKEAEIMNRFSGQPSIDTVYIGGGTPSILEPRLLDILLSGIRSVFDFSADIEYSVEANPCSFSKDFLSVCVNNGVNRFSLGMQSSSEIELKMLGRIHVLSDVERAVSILQKNNITNFNLDLMFGLPGQSLSSWYDTINCAVAFRPSHISCYGLIPEPGTLLKAYLDTGYLSLPDPEIERDMYYSTVALLASSGYYQYEISNFARKDMECRHNIGYWKQDEYIGLGLGASSMYAAVHEENGYSYIRTKNLSDLNAYMKNCTNMCFEESEYISPGESRFETLMLGLRMNEGVRFSDFRKMHGIGINDLYRFKLIRLEKEGYLNIDSERISLTAKGMDMQNYVLVELMS